MSAQFFARQAIELGGHDRSDPHILCQGAVRGARHSQKHLLVLDQLLAEVATALSDYSEAAGLVVGGSLAGDRVVLVQLHAEALLGQSHPLALPPESEACGLELGSHRDGVGGDLNRSAEVAQRCP
jgi:hypothetical protein